MKVSYNWLRELSGTKLEVNKLADLLTLHSFEFSIPEKKGDDWFFDLDILPNRRPDASSHLGVAREIVALSKGVVKIPKTKPLAKVPKLKPSVLSVSVSKKELAPRYTAVLLDNIKIRTSPSWMQKRLIALGMRPIDAAVDITNYVMMEIGSPLHAFDYDKILGKEMRIREARAGEKLVTLDGVERVLSPGAIIIEDEGRVIDLAGIMGGLNSAVDKNTKRILLQAAIFDKTRIYRAARLMNHRTEAAMRYSSGFDDSIALLGLSRAMLLFEEILGAKAVGVIDIKFKSESSKNIFLSFDKLDDLLGKEVKPTEAEVILQRLGCEIITKSSAKVRVKSAPVRVLMVKPPAWRKDISIPEDLIEEIGRVIGWNKIPALVSEHSIGSVEPDELLLLQAKARSILVGAGMSEIYNYSFVSSQDLKAISYKLKASLEVENPTSEDFQYLRPTLLINLLKNTRDNFRFFDNFQFFEIGKVFSKIAGKQGLAGVKENLRLAGITALKTKKRGTQSFFQAKGVADGLLEAIGIPERWYDDVGATSEVAPDALFHPTRRAEIKIDSEEIGFVGEIHPYLLGKFDISGEVAAFELDFEKLAKLSREEREFKPIPKYPAVMRDISFIVSADIRVAEAEDLIWNAGSKILVDVELIDVFEPSSAPSGAMEGKPSFAKATEGKASMTFRLVFQSDKKTLTDKEVNEEMLKIQKTLQEELWAEIR